MNLKLSNGFEITTTPFAFRLLRNQTKVNKETNLEEDTVVTKADHSTLEGIFNCYLSHNIHCSEANDMNELKKLVEDTRKEICEQYSISPKQLKDWRSTDEPGRT